MALILPSLVARNIAPSTSSRNSYANPLASHLLEYSAINPNDIGRNFHATYSGQRKTLDDFV